ncbi:transposable element Tcb2 transposase [Trichonephila clavipes]|nr:transposable element Tcb2 transposase [Trichonephila clavipes]
MMEAGWSARRLACQLGRSDYDVMRCWDQWIREMSFTRRPCLGRPLQTNRRENRLIVRNACIQPTASLAAIQAQVAPSLGAPVSSRTIRKRLAEGHFRSRHPIRVLPLTPTYRRLHLERCRARGYSTAVEWNQVVSRNANPNSISAVMTIVFVCGEPVENASILFLLYTDTPLSQLPSGMSMTDILQPHVLPLMRLLPGAISQQDNARPHTTRMSQDYLRTVTTFPWPARSPDLSPIEQI